MSTLSVTNLKNAASATNNLVLNPDGSVNISGGTLSPQTGFKNRIINGAMTIDQRNAGASVTPATSGTYLLDRWKQFQSAASKFSVQQSSVAPAGFSNSMLITSLAATSLSATDFYVLDQVIEGFNITDLNWGTANAAPITISFWVRSSLTGTFGGALTNSAATRSYPFTYAISAANTFEYKTITIAGDTSGTWLTSNGAGIQVQLGLGVGTTYSGTAGAWATSGFIASATGATSVVGTSGATFYITGVQLEKGSTATPFEFRSIGQELALCQRYLPAFVGNGIQFGFGLAGSATVFACTASFPVQARVAPTGVSVSAASDFNATDYYAASATVLSVAFGSGGVNNASISGTVAGSLTSVRPTTMISTNANAKLFFTGCEL